MYRKETGFQGRKPERKINVFTQTNEAEKDKEKKQMVRFDEIYEQRAKIKRSYEAQKRLIQLNSSPFNTAYNSSYQGFGTKKLSLVWSSLFLSISCNKQNWAGQSEVI